MRNGTRRGFTLTELLVVIGIMAILAAVSLPALRGTGDAGRFNMAVSGLSGLLEQARSTALAQNTYVWAVLWETVAPGKEPELHVGLFSSNDGTDPFGDGETGSVSLPSPGTVGETKLAAVNRLTTYTGVHLTRDNLPSQAPADGPFPAATPDFHYAVPGGAELSATGGVAYGVVEFSPSGTVRSGVGNDTPTSLWIGLQPAHSATARDDKNVAALRINGLTGSTTAYRK